MDEDLEVIVYLLIFAILSGIFGFVIGVNI